MKQHRSRRRGMALIIVLAFVVLITILVVGLASSMRIDRPAANSHLEKKRAAIYAQTGVEDVIATLDQYTTGTSGYWISQPGQLVVGAQTDDPGTAADDRKTLEIAVPLYSGSAGAIAGPAQLQPPNLNVPMWRDPNTHLITDRPSPSNPSEAVPMSVAWIDVTQDGIPSKVLRYDAGSNPGASEWIDNPDYHHDSKANPIVGRYAYWTDDESSKVNYNLAWKRDPTGADGNTFPASHPTKIDLTALSNMTPGMADAIHDYLVTGTNYATLNHPFFNTPGDARQVDTVYPGVAAALQANKFEVTHYNHDPDTTFFNQPRIVLTTQKSRAGGKPFLDLGIPDVNNLWNTSQIDPLKVQATVAMLVSYLQRTDWPMTPGSSFQQKYYSSYALADQKTRLVQLALNIIDYVRSKESPSPLVVPIRGTATVDPDSNATTFTLNPNPSASDTSSIIGITRSPRINEMALVKSGSNYFFKVELYLPPHFGIQSLGDITQPITIGGVPRYFGFINRVGNRPANFKVDVQSTFGPSGDGSLSVEGNSTLNAGGYVTIRQAIPTLSGTAILAGDTPIAVTGTMGLRACFQFNGGKLDLAPLIDPNTSSGQALYTMDPDGTPEADAGSIEVDDPRINTFKGDWKQSSKNSFGAVNGRYSVGHPMDPSISPQQDTDASGNISAASLYMPPPAGQKITYADGFVDDNTAGMVLSVGELGYIHTGMESTAKAGTNWRTLRLQPSNQDATVVPDWALMDLFTVPIVVPPAAAQIFAPQGTSYGGRVNLNSMAVPFNMDRTLPLAAVLQGARSGPTATLSPEDASSYAQNIYNRVLAPKNSATGAYGKLYGDYQAGYVSPGEIVEVRGIADHGEESEALVREVANLVTVRGDVFSVYTVGQAIKETAAGKLIVKGEQRLQAMIERKSVPREDAAGAPVIDPATGLQKIDVHVTPVFIRNLTP